MPVLPIYIHDFKPGDVKVSCPHATEDSKSLALNIQDGSVVIETYCGRPGTSIVMPPVVMDELAIKWHAYRMLQAKEVEKTASGLSAEIAMLKDELRGFYSAGPDSNRPTLTVSDWPNEFPNELR